MAILDIELKSTFDDKGVKAAKTAVDGMKKTVEGLEQGIGNPLSKIGNAIGNVFKTGAIAAGTGAAAITASVVGIATKGLMSFSDLQAGMNEVFTLLPGMSEKAMGAMTADLQAFDTQFGVLSEESVPALYQAISAGVPSDNVFSFLEISQKAAVGGVTDLTTAIDGITSVVNAYGSDIVDATKASDLMFTAVRLGKTDFGQLSSSLFNVIPTAASLGVKFDDVTAALASMTAQGVPTSVATTQLRQLLVELSKDGTKTSDIFKEIAGKSFRDFIASGKNTQDALQLLEKYAAEANVGANDLFGSVEAGNAILALTGRGTEAFSKALAEMGNSAGATDQAYATMEQGIGRSLQKMQAVFSTMFEKIGKVVEPVFNQILTWGNEQLPAMTDLVVDVFGDIADWAGEYLPEALAFLGEKLDWLKENGQRLVSEGLSKLSEGFSYVKDTIIPLVQEWMPKIVDTLSKVIQASAPVIEIAGRLIDKFVAMDGSQQRLVIAIGAVVAALPTIIPIATGLVTAVGGIISIISGGAGLIAALGALTNPIGIVVAAVAGLAIAWNRDFGGIRTKTASVASDVQNGLVSFGMSLSMTWNGITSNLTNRWNDAFGSVKATIGNALRDVVDTLGSWVQVGKEIVAGVIKGIGDMAVSAIRSVTGFFGNIIGAAKDALGIRSPSAVFAQIGHFMMEGLEGGIASGGQRAIDALGSVADSMIGRMRASAEEIQTIDLLGSWNMLNPDAPKEVNPFASLAAFGQQTEVLRRALQNASDAIQPQEFFEMINSAVTTFVNDAFNFNDQGLRNQAADALESLLNMDFITRGMSGTNTAGFNNMLHQRAWELRNPGATWTTEGATRIGSIDTMARDILNTWNSVVNQAGQNTDSILDDFGIVASLYG